jgi:hypothetical protein
MAKQGILEECVEHALNDGGSARFIGVGIERQDSVLDDVDARDHAAATLEARRLEGGEHVGPDQRHATGLLPVLEAEPGQLLGELNWWLETQQLLEDLRAIPRASGSDQRAEVVTCCEQSIERGAGEKGRRNPVGLNEEVLLEEEAHIALGALRARCRPEGLAGLVQHAPGVRAGAVGGVELDRDRDSHQAKRRVQAATDVTSKALFFQLEFNGIGQIGSNETVNLFRRNVPGYAVTNPRDQALAPPSLQPQLPFEQVF